MGEYFSQCAYYARSDTKKKYYAVTTYGNALLKISRHYRARAYVRKVFRTDRPRYIIYPSGALNKCTERDRIRARYTRELEKVSPSDRTRFKNVRVSVGIRNKERDPPYGFPLWNVFLGKYRTINYTALPQATFSSR